MQSEIIFKSLVRHHHFYCFDYVGLFDLEYILTVMVPKCYHRIHNMLYLWLLELLYGLYTLYDMMLFLFICIKYYSVNSGAIYHFEISVFPKRINPMYSNKYLMFIKILWYPSNINIVLHSFQWIIHIIYYSINCGVFKFIAYFNLF